MPPRSISGGGLFSAWTGALPDRCQPMFTNKHVVIAMIVAPILAVLAWIAVGQLGGEKPHAAMPGQSYPLVAKSNCRYPSGACDLENEDFRLTLVYSDDVSGPQLLLRASHALAGVVLAVTTAAADEPPSSMQASDEAGREWRLALAAAPTPEQRIRLVARAGGSSYFADTSTLFLQDEGD